MLTDIFADRYLSLPMWESFGEADRRFIIQGFRMVSEQLYPYWVDGKENPHSKAKWGILHDKLSMELGLSELSPKYYSYQTTWNGKSHTQSGAWTLDKVCENFICAQYTGNIPADRFIKERISFVELAFREREEEVAKANEELPKKITEAELHEKSRPARGLRLPGSWVDSLKAANETMNKMFQESVYELNERLRRAGYNLNYHNGFIQISDDKLLEEQVEREFWSLTKDPLWKNVDIDMKEAIDLRDSNGRDPAFYASR